MTHSRRHSSDPPPATFARLGSGEHGARASAPGTPSRTLAVLVPYTSAPDADRRAWRTSAWPGGDDSHAGRIGGPVGDPCDDLNHVVDVAEAAGAAGDGEADQVHRGRWLSGPLRRRGRFRSSRQVPEPDGEAVASACERDVDVELVHDPKPQPKPPVRGAAGGGDQACQAVGGAVAGVVDGD